jgi:AcrR family transcriptional regulator
MPARRRKARREQEWPAGGNLRDATKRETRAALLRAGMELFARQGLDVPSLDALCARAGFSRGAFYVHFKDREDFIVAVMAEATGRFLEAILATGGEGLELEQIVQLFAASLTGPDFPVFGMVPMRHVMAACARSKVLRARYQEIVGETIVRLAEAVRAAQAAGRVRPGLDPMTTAGLLIAIALGVGAVRELGVEFDAPAYAQTLLRMLQQ